MKESKEKTGCCDPCEQQFREEVDELVENVKGYTRKDHREKKEEVKDAFASDGKSGSEKDEKKK